MAVLHHQKTRQHSQRSSVEWFSIGRPRRCLQGSNNRQTGQHQKMESTTHRCLLELTMGAKSSRRQDGPLYVETDGPGTAPDQSTPAQH
eukprot:2551693-Amphidinium_carterae.2